MRWALAGVDMLVLNVCGLWMRPGDASVGAGGAGEKMT
jgi:hypothetical protein